MLIRTTIIDYHRAGIFSKGGFMILRMVLFVAVLCIWDESLANTKFYCDQITSMKGQEEIKYEAKDDDHLWRIPLVEWAFNFSYQYQVPYEVVSLTIEIYENFLTKKEPKVEERSLYFSVCYVLAVKILHNDIRYDEIVKYAKQTNKSQLVKMEKEICDLLRWRLYYVTPHSYLSVIRSHLNDKVGHKIADQLMSSATVLAERSLYQSKRGLTNYEIALNCMIDALNRSKIHPADWDQIFVALNRIL